MGHMVPKTIHLDYLVEGTETQCDVEFRFVAFEANFSFVQNERLKNVNGCLPTLVLFSVLSCH